MGTEIFIRRQQSHTKSQKNKKYNFYQILTLGMKLVLFLALIGLCQSRPPVKEKPKGKPAQNETNAEWDVGVEYNRYLQEVVQVLESDPEFRKKLKKAGGLEKMLYYNDG